MIDNNSPQFGKKIYILLIFLLSILIAMFYASHRYEVAYEKCLVNQISIESRYRWMETNRTLEHLDTLLFRRGSIDRLTLALRLEKIQSENNLMWKELQEQQQEFSRCPFNIKTDIIKKRDEESIEEKIKDFIESQEKYYLDNKKINFDYEVDLTTFPLSSSVYDEIVNYKVEIIAKSTNEILVVAEANASGLKSYIGGFAFQSGTGNVAKVLCTSDNFSTTINQPLLKEDGKFISYECQ